MNVSLSNCLSIDTIGYMQFEFEEFFKVKLIIAGLGRLLCILSNIENCEKDDRNNEITARDAISITHHFDLVRSSFILPKTYHV